MVHCCCEVIGSDATPVWSLHHVAAGRQNMPHYPHFGAQSQPGLYQLPHLRLAVLGRGVL